MSVKTKLLISMLVDLCLVLLVATVFAATLSSGRQSAHKTALATELNASITELRFVTFEHLINHDARSLEQWQLKYQGLTDELKPQASATPAEQRILADMLEEHGKIKSLFERLASSYSEAPTTADQSALGNFRERLAGQLLVRQQAQITQAAQLATLTQAEATRQQTRYAWISFGTILLMLLVMATNAGLVMSTISRALRELQTGASQIAKGNLKYRIPIRRRDEFGQLAEAFNAMAASLKHIDQTKSEFILMASHQLRTPATAVKGFVSLVIDGYAGPVTAEQAGVLHSAIVENDRQLQLVDEMLVVAQAETGEMMVTPIPTDLVELVNTIVTTQTPILKARSQSLQLTGTLNTLMAPADADKLRIAIENLITNASSYSPPHTTIELGLGVSDNQALIEVKDQGAGIAKADQAKLFKKFSRLNNTGVTRIEGAGLGLYLVKKIVDLHHGTIGVASRPGHGSIFTIRLPRSPK